MYFWNPELWATSSCLERLAGWLVGYLVIEYSWVCGFIRQLHLLLSFKIRDDQIATRTWINSYDDRKKKSCTRYWWNKNRVSVFVDNSFMQFLGRCYYGSNRNLEMGALLYHHSTRVVIEVQLIDTSSFKAKPKLELHSISIHRIQNYYRIVENHKLKRCQFLCRRNLESK